MFNPLPFEEAARMMIQHHPNCPRDPKLDTPQIVYGRDITWMDPPFEVDDNFKVVVTDDNCDGWFMGLLHSIEYHLVCKHCGADIEFVRNE